VRELVAEIGRKSLGCVGPDVFGTGQILACFHCIGTTDVLIDMLISSARVFDNLLFVYFS